MSATATREEMRMAFCYQCGMPVGPDGTYHPNAACLMYEASEDVEQVRANLAAVVEYGAAAERARIRRELEALVKEWAASRETASLRDPGKIFAEHLRAAMDQICPAPVREE
jgi:hypothetical protein